MTVKKAYTDIVNFLEANKEATVADVLEDVIAMASAKTARSTAGSTYLMDTEGNPVAIFCYYFKRWMPLVGDDAVEFGAKKNTATGYNPMCKEGVSNWSKQQREAKAANEGLVDRIASGTLAVEDIRGEQEAIEEARKQIIETDLGFETKDEVIAYLEDLGLELANQD